jgi:hypothetical protein
VPPHRPLLQIWFAKDLTKNFTSMQKALTQLIQDMQMISHFQPISQVFDETFKKNANVNIIEVQEKFKINFEKERLQSSGQRQAL